MQKFLTLFFFFKLTIRCYQGKRLKLIKLLEIIIRYQPLKLPVESTQRQGIIFNYLS